jgi:hypothetical protein
MASFSEGEVVIYEGYMEDILCVFDKYDEEFRDFIYLNEFSGEPYRTTTIDRIRPITIEGLKNKIAEVESQRETLLKALELAGKK